MSKKAYAEQLLSDEWKAKRLAILKRDGFQCGRCGSKKKLHVHHKKYINGLKAWEVPDKYLITLCVPCHEKTHEIKPISTFVKKPPTKSRAEKTANKIAKMKAGLSAKDRQLQERYDKLKAH